MNYKPFSQKEYEENNSKAKNLALRFLLSRGYYRLDIPLEKQPEAYKRKDFDIFHTKLNKVILVEAERKKVWTNSGLWQTCWDTLDVPYRKEESEAQVYVMSNLHWDTIAVAKMPEVQKAIKKLKDCKCDNVKTENEPFFRCKLGIFKFFKSVNKQRTLWVEITPYGKEIGDKNV